MRIPGLLDRFRIRLPYSKNNRFVDVFLWENKRFLQKHNKQKRDVEGFFQPSPYRIYPRKHVPKKIGEIHYHKGRIGIGVISHEAAHATIHLAEALGLDILDKDNEVVCHALGYFVKEICGHFITKGYYDRK